MSPTFVNTFILNCEIIPFLENDKLNTELGHRLRSEREKLGLSQSYLADLLNRDQTSISKMEKGLRQISVSEFIIWCNTLNLSLEQIIQLIQIGPYKNE